MPNQIEHPVLHVLHLPGKERPFALCFSNHPVWLNYKDKVPEEFKSYLFPELEERFRFKSESDAVQISDKIQIAMASYIELSLKEHEKKFSKHENQD